MQDAEQLLVLWTARLGPHSQARSAPLKHHHRFPKFPQRELQPWVAFETQPCASFQFALGEGKR